MSLIALLVAALIGFNPSDCNPGSVVTLYEDFSYRSEADSQAITCEDSWSVDRGDHMAYRVITITLTSQSTYRLDGYWYLSPMPFPDSVITWHTYGSIHGDTLVYIMPQ
jgi:hypothetical protein